MPASGSRISIRFKNLGRCFEIVGILIALPSGRVAANDKRRLGQAKVLIIDRSKWLLVRRNS
jgi:hypothetical protein